MALLFYFGAGVHRPVGLLLSNAFIFWPFMLKPDRIDVACLPGIHWAAGLSGPTLLPSYLQLN